MTSDAVERAIKHVVRQSFGTGVEAARKKMNSRLQAAEMEKCVTYAVALLMPTAEAWVQEGIEQAATARLRAAPPREGVP